MEIKTTRCILHLPTNAHESQNKQRIQMIHNANKQILWSKKVKSLP